MDKLLSVQRSLKEGCDGRVLYTLQPGADPGKSLQNLLNVRKGANSGPLSETNQRIYINVSSFLEEAPTIEQTPSAVQNDPPANPSPNIW